MTQKKPDTKYALEYLIESIEFNNEMRDESLQQDVPDGELEPEWKVTRTEKNNDMTGFHVTVKESEFVVVIIQIK